MIYFQLFLSFLQIGAFSIGGGYAAMPLIREQVVLGHHWLTMPEFTDLITIAEMTPGPISINAATFVGIRIAGIPGALVATFGSILPSCLIVSVLALVYRKYRGSHGLETVLDCLRPVVVALIAAAGLSILQTVLLGGQTLCAQHIQWISAAVFLAAFVILRRWKWNPILVMTLCGAAGLGLNLWIGGLPT